MLELLVKKAISRNFITKKKEINLKVFSGKFILVFRKKKGLNLNFDPKFDEIEV